MGLFPESSEGKRDDRRVARTGQGKAEQMEELDRTTLQNLQRKLGESTAIVGR